MLFQKKKWCKIPINTAKLVEYLARRVEAVLPTKGGPTSYQTIWIKNGTSLKFVHVWILLAIMVYHLSSVLCFLLLRCCFYICVYVFICILILCSLHSIDVSSKRSLSYSNSRPCSRLSSLMPSCRVGVTWPNSQLPPSLCWRFRGRKPSRWNSGRSSSNSSNSSNNILLLPHKRALKTELYVTQTITKDIVDWNRIRAS